MHWDSRLHYSQPTSRRVHAPDGEGAHLQVSQVFSPAPLGPAKGGKGEEEEGPAAIRTGGSTRCDRTGATSPPRHIGAQRSSTAFSPIARSAAACCAPSGVTRVACLVVLHALFLGVPTRGGHRAPVCPGRTLNNHTCLARPAPAGGEAGRRVLAGAPRSSTSYPARRLAASPPGEQQTLQHAGLGPRSLARAQAAGGASCRRCVRRSGVFCFGWRKRGAPLPCLAPLQLMRETCGWPRNMQGRLCEAAPLGGWECLLTSSRPLPGERPAARVRGLPLPGGPGAPSGRAD